MHLYAIARPKGKGLEYFYRTNPETKQIEWTDDPKICWAITRIDWAQTLWWALLKDEHHYECFVHQLSPSEYWSPDDDMA